MVIVHSKSPAQWQVHRLPAASEINGKEASEIRVDSSTHRVALIISKASGKLRLAFSALYMAVERQLIMRVTPRSS
jgi:hypothetical protein